MIPRQGTCRFLAGIQHMIHALAESRGEVCLSGTHCRKYWIYNLHGNCIAMHLSIFCSSLTFGAPWMETLGITNLCSRWHCVLLLNICLWRDGWEGFQASQSSGEVQPHSEGHHRRLTCQDTRELKLERAPYWAHAHRIDYCPKQRVQTVQFPSRKKPVTKAVFLTVI